MGAAIRIIRIIRSRVRKLFLSRRSHLDPFSCIEPWMSQRSISVISSFHWIVNLLFPTEKFKQSEQCTLKLFRLTRLRHSGHFRLRCIKTERCNTAEVCRKQLDVPIMLELVVPTEFVRAKDPWFKASKIFTMKMRTSMPRELQIVHALCVLMLKKNSSGICSERTSSKSSKLKLKRRSNRSSLPSSVSFHSCHHLSLPTTSAMCGGCWGGWRGASVIPPVPLNWRQF